MAKKIKAGIVGGAGYTGGELIRLLINHPHAEIHLFIAKAMQVILYIKFTRICWVKPNLTFTGELSDDIDVLFLCVGHGEAKKFLAENKINDRIRIIDLSQDFRLPDTNTFGERKFIYGFPELNKDEISFCKEYCQSGLLCNSIQLGLLPLAKAGLLSEIYTTGITGSTGAGQGLAATSHFSWRANNIQAYKTLTHQHLDEIGDSLMQA